MKIFITALLLLITSITLAQQTNCDSIVWSSTRKLTWADYRGYPVAATRADARTNYNFLHRWHVEDNVLTGKVICIFSPCRSWSKIKTSTTLLAHEQGHFDIAEYFRRVYNQRILQAKYTPRTLRPIVVQFYIDIQRECEQVQDTYDTETTHGLNAEKQSQWLNRIQSMLDSMSQYDAEDVKVKLL